MPKHTISFAKLFSPPSPTAWAQTYHAGNVYTVVSVTQTEANPRDPEHAIPSVHVLGKDIINNLEAEYFAIATKTLETMKEAVVNACKEIPEDASATVIFGVIQENILYLFLYGKGHVYIKRGAKFGVLLEMPNDLKETKQVIAISGPMLPSDIVILATEQFLQAVPQEALAEQLLHTPAEIAETFSTKMDDEQYAGAAAIIFSVDGTKESMEQKVATNIHSTEKKIEQSSQLPTQPKPTFPEREEEEVIVEKPITKPLMETVEEKNIQQPVEEKTATNEEKMNLDEKPRFAFEEEEVLPKEKKETKRKFPKPSLRQTFFLLVAITLAGILGTSIFVTQRKQQTTQAQTLFSSQFPSAKQDYDEGQSLLSLNKNLASDDFSKAKTILEKLKISTASNSSDASQVNTLLDKVNQALGPATSTQTSSLKQADSSASKLLTAEVANPTFSYFTQDTSTIYGADNNAVDQIDNSNKTSSLIKNANDWTDIGGFGTYLGNFYLLDKKSDQILKFTKAADSYGKTNYFSDSSQSLSQATSITIDGSIWILFNDGSIKKYTKGKPDQFTIGKLDKPLVQPTRIVTTVDMDNIYILDNGNKRIVVLKKTDGSLVNQYGASVLQKAKDMDIDEKNKKIYVLINNTIFEIDM